MMFYDFLFLGKMICKNGEGWYFRNDDWLFDWDVLVEYW